MDTIAPDCVARFGGDYVPVRIVENSWSGIERNKENGEMSTQMSLRELNEEKDREGEWVTCNQEMRKVVDSHGGSVGMV